MGITEFNELKLNGKTYQLKKVGVSDKLLIQSVFMRIVIHGGIPENLDTRDPDIVKFLMLGVKGDVIPDIKKIVINTVESPKLDNDKYELLEIDEVVAIYSEIHNINIADPEAKKKEQELLSKKEAQPETEKGHSQS